MQLRTIFDESLLNHHYTIPSLTERGFEYHEYENGCSQVLGTSYETMLLISELAETTVRLLDATTYHSSNQEEI